MLQLLDEINEFSNGRIKIRDQSSLILKHLQHHYKLFRYSEHHSVSRYLPLVVWAT